MRSSFTTILALLLVLSARPARADNPTREFVMSCTYGVLAGTLVGAASLAFTKKPSDNMHRVARGASIGLYTGILLGLYVVYVVPGMEEGADEYPVASLEKRLDKIRFMVSPTTGLREDIDGLRGDWTMLRF